MFLHIREYGDSISKYMLDQNYNTFIKINGIYSPLKDTASSSLYIHILLLFYKELILFESRLDIV